MIDNEVRSRDLGMLATIIRHPHIYEMNSDELRPAKMELYPVASYLLAQLAALHKKYYKFPTKSEFLSYLKIRLKAHGDKVPIPIQEQTFHDAREIFDGDITPLSQDMLAEYLYHRKIPNIVQQLTKTGDPEENVFDRLEPVQEELSRLSLIQSAKTGVGERFLRPLSRSILDNPKKAMDMAYRGVRVPLGMKYCDQILRGGFKPGTMGFVVAPVGRGKTLFLIQLAIYAVTQGLRVLYYALDNTKEDLIERSLSQFGSTAISEEWEVSQWSEHLHSVVAMHYGEDWEDYAYTLLNIALRRRGEVTWKDIWRDAIELEYVYRSIDSQYTDRPMERRGMTDLVVIDYGDLMKPSNLTGKKYDDQAVVFNDMTNLAETIGCAVASGTQTHRDSLVADDIDLHNIADCYPKTWPADWVACICQNAQEERENRCRLKWAKLRRVQSRYTVHCHIDYDMMVITEDETKKPEFTPTSRNSPKFKSPKTKQTSMKNRKFFPMVEDEDGNMRDRKTGRRINPAHLDDGDEFDFS